MQDELAEQGNASSVQEEVKPKTQKQDELNLADSGMLQPVKKRAYAEGVQDLTEINPDPEEPKYEGNESFETIEKPKKSNRFEMPITESAKQDSIPDSPEMTFEKREEIIDSGATAPPAIDQAVKQAANSTADWIWNNFENITPELLHLSTKIDENKYDDLGIDPETLGIVKDTISKANSKNKGLLEIKDWHKDNIYPPLKEYLQENGMDVKVPAWAKLLIGVIIVAGMLWISVREVKSSNRFLLRDLDRRLDDLLKKKKDSE
jgi:hypothetical protein